MEIKPAQKMATTAAAVAVVASGVAEAPLQLAKATPVVRQQLPAAEVGVEEVGLRQRVLTVRQAQEAREAAARRQH